MKPSYAVPLFATLMACGGGVSSSETFLVAPPAELGFQFKTNQEPVPAGAETQNCYFFAVPKFTGERWMNRFELKERAGTHHVAIFQVDTNQTVLIGGPGDVIRGSALDPVNPCRGNGTAGWPILFNSQNGGANTDWKMPPGVGMPIRSEQLLMMQVHYVNANTQVTPTVAEAAFNVYWTDQRPEQVSTGRFATARRIRACPGQPPRITSESCLFPATKERTIMAMTGHYHARGRLFEAEVFDASKKSLGIVYHSESWSEPEFLSGISLKVPAGGSVEWRCTHEALPTDCGNPADSCCFGWGPSVETNEHCNFTFYYYPAEDTLYDVTTGQPTNPTDAIDCASEEPFRWNG